MTGREFSAIWNIPPFLVLEPALSRFTCSIDARSPGVGLRAARHWEKTKSSDGKTN
jgi:hypothetical protein